MDHQPAQDRPEQPEGMGPSMVLCPYCGSLSAHHKQCAHCGGHFDLLSRQRSQNAMGPWFIRDVTRPFNPGCSLSTLTRMVQRGRIRPETVIRGPSTRQFWTFAKNTPGIGHLFGECHACHTAVMPIAKLCPSCNASFVADDDRQNMGLSPVHLLPGDADAATIAASIGTKGPTPTIPTQTPLPMPVAPPPEKVEEDDEFDDPPFDVPEVRVISADEQRKPVGLIVALAFAAVLVAGVGLWAWGYISELSEPETTQASPVQVQNEDAAVADPSAVNESNELTNGAADHVTDEPRDSAEVPEPEPTPGEEVQIDPSPAVEQAGDTSAETQSAEQIAYDRALLGIASGSLDDAEFDTLLAQVSERRRQDLVDARARRVEQMRLGRAGN